MDILPQMVVVVVPFRRKSRQVKRAACGRWAADRSSTVISTHSVPEEARSGFLRDYDRLEKVQGEEGVLRWVKPDVDWIQYTRFMVDPIQFRVPPAHETDAQPRPEIVAAARSDFRGALIRELGSRYVITDKPGIGVARLRVALTAVDPNLREIKSWEFIPVVFLETGAPETNGSHGKNLRVFMEEALSDSVSGKLLSEAIQGRTSREVGSAKLVEANAEDMKPVLDFWASEAAEQVARRRSESK
jgi:hypothetical protein